MGKPIKRSTRARKCKCKCKCHQKLSIVKKGQQIKENDTLSKAPVRTLLPTNGVTFKVKMRKK